MCPVLLRDLLDTRLEAVVNDCCRVKPICRSLMFMSFVGLLLCCYPHRERQLCAYGVSGVPSFPRTKFHRLDATAFHLGYDFLEQRAYASVSCFSPPGCCGISGSLALQEMRSLSGGQKSRVVLAELMTRRPHILLLDEVFCAYHTVASCRCKRRCSSSKRIRRY